MSRREIAYEEWMAALGNGTLLSWPETADAGRRYNRRAMASVTTALALLDDQEAAFIRLYYFQGIGYGEISRVTGREVHRLESLHQAALRKLRLRLERHQVARDDAEKTISDPDCPLCCHCRRDEIDRLIRQRPASATWRGIMETLRREFGLTINTPQRLIGHEKYHMI